MMFKKIIYSIVVLIIILFNTKDVNCLSNYTNKSLIVYEIENEFGELENKSNHLKQLLYAFNKTVDTLSIEDYKSNQLEKYDSIFVMNVIESIENKEFLRDLSSYKNNIYWIGNRIEDYLNYSEKYEIAFQNKNNNITSINYKNKNFLVRDNSFYNIISESENSETISTISDGYKLYPYIIKEKNLYYISSYSIGETYVLEDTLYDFYNMESYDLGKVFLKIEDINKEIDIKNLKKISKYLYSKNIPFIVSMKTLERDSEKYLEIVRVLQDVQKEGGSIILNEDPNRMSYEDTEMYIENSLYPLAIDTSHLTNKDEESINNSVYISTYIGEYENNSYDNVKSTFPYIVKNSDICRIFIPQNMGNIDEDIFSIDIIKDNYNKVSIVRGYTAGICFSSDVNIDKLKEVINFTQDNRCEYLNLKYIDNVIKIGDVKISSKDGDISSNYDELKLSKNKEEEQKQYKFFRSINDVVILFVIIVLIIFVVIFIIFKRINKDKFVR